MATTTAFRGWSDEVIGFYRGLEADNSKTYWQEHKAIYDEQVRPPFDALNELVADEFGELHVFRPYRDTRFSTDKSPYKTRCYGVAEGEGGEAFYVEISGAGLVAASGFWMMAKDQLERYRSAVDDEVTGGALEAIVADLRGSKLTIEGHALKTAPRGYPRDHPRVELLRHKSLAALRRFEPARWLHTKAAADRITGTWRAAAALNGCSPPTWAPRPSHRAIDGPAEPGRDARGGAGVGDRRGSRKNGLNRTSRDRFCRSWWGARRQGVVDDQEDVPWIGRSS